MSSDYSFQSSQNNDNSPSNVGKSKQKLKKQITIGEIQQEMEKYQKMKYNFHQKNFIELRMLLENYITDSENEDDQMNNQVGKVNKDEFNILLAHTPFYFDEYEKWGADLTLCGHVHGGVVRLPFVGGLLSPDRKFFPKYDLGKYEKNNSTMLVSKGLGGSKVLIRINCKPEIVSIKLKSDIT